MPVYVCYRGDCDHLALHELGQPPFVAQDALGREWLCVETTQTKIDDGLPPSSLEMLMAQRAAYKQGHSAEGTEQRFFDCADEASLRRELILRTYPPAADSEARLALAGWFLQRLALSTGEPVKLTITDSRETINVEADSENEAWYRARQKVLGSSAELQKEKPVMTLTAQTVPVPLRTDENGVARVGDSRVVLDVVVREFNNGACPEEIVRGYPTLELADVYAVLAYYLRHRDEVDEYLQARREEADRLRQEIEAARPGRANLREKLLTRKAQMERRHASPSK
jgi:uncharacterized protein (DUF433 family)